jgi:putative ABC transport system permease protein
VLLSLIIAFPVAWYASSQWLQHYVYRVTLDWWVFALVAILVLCIALFTVSFQAIKAAIANPVKSLRTE